MDINSIAKKLQTEGAINIFNTVYSYFEKGIPEEEKNSELIEDIVIETIDSVYEQSDFDKFFKFIDLLKNKYPQIYIDQFDFIDPFLVEYYCFEQDNDKIKDAFANFAQYPLYEFPTFVSTVNILNNFQYDKIALKAISDNFEKITSQNDLDKTALGEYKKYLFYTKLEEFLDQNPNIQINETEKIEAFFSPFKINLISKGSSFILDKFITKENFCAEEYSKLISTDVKQGLKYLRFGFLQYMQNLNFSFSFTGALADKLLKYFDRENEGQEAVPAKFFDLDKDSFKHYLLFYEKPPESYIMPQIIAHLWGSVYFYEFLYTQKIIPEITYQVTLEILRQLKGQVISCHIFDLWKYNFVHHWTKPESISEEYFKAKRKLFEKTKEVNGTKNPDVAETFKNELEALGDAAKYIYEESEEDFFILSDGEFFDEF